MFSIRPLLLGGLLSVGVMFGTGCSSGGTASTSTPVGPTPAPSVTKVFVVSGEFSQVPSSSGTSFTYQSSELQFDAASSGASNPVVNMPVTNALVRGIALDSSGEVFVGESQIGAGSLPNTVQTTSAFVQVFAAGFTATSAPIRTITLPNHDPAEAITVDGAGQLYVVSSATGSIYVFAAGADSSAAPIRTITASALLTSARGIAVDAAGQIYVSNFGPSEVLVFSATADGNAAPVRTIAISGGGAYGVAVNANGNAFVSVNDVTGTATTGVIQEFDTAANGAATPINTIGGSSTELTYGGNLQVDKSGNIWLVNYTRVYPSSYSSVLEFSSSATGNIAPLRSFTSTSWDPYSGPSIAVE